MADEQNAPGCGARANDGCAQSPDERKKARDRKRALRSYHKHKDDPGRREERRRRNKEWRERNGERKSAYNRAYRKADAARIAEKNREWRVKNAVILLQKKRAHYASNRDASLARNRMWRMLNADRHRANSAAWSEANRERKKAYDREWRRANPRYEAERYRAEISYRIAKRLRGRHRAALATARARKSSSLLHLLGCSGAELLAHLEAQFVEGMSWENYGAWHIDHKRPICTFNLSDPAQQRLAFHYTNLRPLWAADNLARPRKAWRPDAKP